MRRARFLALFVALLTLVASLIAVPAAAETEVVDTIRVSVATDGAEANSWSSLPAISADGSTITYTSLASNLVTGDNNRTSDVFAYDVATGTTTRISVATDGTEANRWSYEPAISADGSTITYYSHAWNLVTGDTNTHPDVFAYDMATATTTRISVATDGTPANGDSVNPAVSGDGSTITYTSLASNLVAGDTNTTYDVFAYDVASATTTRISVTTDGTQADGSSHRTATSGDGSTITYHSGASNLVSGDTNVKTDVFAYDVPTGTTTRISVSTGGAEANGHSSLPTISGDGSTITFGSGASNLVADDTNDAGDVFAYDVATGTTTRISVGPDGSQADGGSGWPVISADGSSITYRSAASNLVAGDTNGFTDVFLTRLKHSPDGTEDCPTITGRANLDISIGVGSARVVLDGKSMRVPFVSTGFVETGPDTADIFFDWFFPSGVVSVVEHARSTPTDGPFGHFGSTVEVLSGGVGEWQWAGTVDYAHSWARIESLSGVLCLE